MKSDSLNVLCTTKNCSASSAKNHKTISGSQFVQKTQGNKESVGKFWLKYNWKSSNDFYFHDHQINVNYFSLIYSHFENDIKYIQTKTLRCWQKRPSTSLKISWTFSKWNNMELTLPQCTFLSGSFHKLTTNIEISNVQTIKNAFSRILNRD